ncbi:folylpolyglutamate synthase [Coemansia sp. RSA 1199]|nr:folylpolyglutamate synthase [Coemansia sp. RSA 1199]
MTASGQTGVTLGLERIVRFLAHVLPSDPRDKLRVVHVAGTNGKGSVCALVSEALTAAGYNVGTFNSPHFLEPHDAVRIQNEAIPAGEYTRLQTWIRTLDSTQTNKLSIFEQTTVLALWWFAQRNVDVAVVEVGMGGLRDATNVFSSVRNGIGSLVQCICPVDEDHLGMIGNNIEEIALEKSGIMRPGSWIVVANQERSEAFHKIRQEAHRTSPGRIINVRRQPTYDIHVPNFVIDTTDVPGRVRPPAELPSWATFKGTGKRCLRVKYPPSPETYLKSSGSAKPKESRESKEPTKSTKTEVDLPLELPGYYQAGNASVAFYALDVLRTHYGFTRLTDAAIQVGFQNVRWPGRLSWLNIAHRRASIVSPTDVQSGSESSNDTAPERLYEWVLADGAHNEPAAVELRKYVDTTLRRISQQRYIRMARSRHSENVCVRWVVGFTQGKDVSAILARLAQPGDEVWAVPFAQPKEMPWITCERPEQIAQTARACSEGVRVEAFDCLADAVDRLAACSADTFLNVVCGSLYLVANVFREFQLEPFPEIT